MEKRGRAGSVYILNCFHERMDYSLIKCFERYVVSNKHSLCSNEYDVNVAVHVVGVRGGAHYIHEYLLYRWLPYTLIFNEHFIVEINYNCNGRTSDNFDCLCYKFYTLSN